ncbi:GNAT family N-acetyltransferase [Xylanimonas oleitrophica]|uniref:GNAT family N-acetyltransferase n=1 Tax=Xylanimonas oleitrophica TaxID=2607479 RepID=UPI001FE30AC4|nr:GNAT family N-acetyltransferase [Xylanimonas oleitrophica]
MTAPAPTSVRRARPDEAAEVAWLAATTFPLACPPGTAAADMARHVATRLTPARFREWAASEEHVLLIATDDETCLGYALLQRGTPDGEQEARVLREATGSAGPYVELSKIYAHPLAQGTGSSSALMRATLEVAGTLGPGLPLWLGTNGDNARAQAFYRKHGFAVVGTRTYDVGGRLHDDVVMLHGA